MLPSKPLDPRNIFIDRTELLSGFEKLLLGGKHTVLIDTMAVYGSGKTTILSQLYHHLDHLGEYTPIWLDIEKINPKEHIENASITHKQRSDVFIFRDMLTILLESIDQKAKHEFINSAETLLSQSLNMKDGVQFGHVETGSIQFGNAATIKDTRIITGDTIIKVDEKYAETMLSSALDLLRHQFADEFLRCIEPVLDKKKNLVFLVDNFCYIIGQQVGGWFLDLLNRLENVSVILARTVTSEDLPSSDSITRFSISGFNRDEIHLYLSRRFGDVQGLDRLTDCLLQFSHGHPGTVTMAADTIRRDELDSIDTLIAFFTQVEREVNPANPRYTDLEQRYDAMILNLLGDVRTKDPDLEIALFAGTVLRFYNRSTLEGVLAPLNEAANPPVKRSSSYYNELVRRLSQYAFVEQLAGKKNEKPDYAFQNFVRERLSWRLRQEDPRLFEQIIEQARDYYQVQMNDLAEKKAKKAYRKNYKMEENVWQESASEWLYYLSIGEDRAAARLHFASVYFEAFNWWNWLLPFDFCILLRRLWQQVQKDEEDGELLRLVNKLENSYPKGYFKANQGDWTAARQALSSLRKLLGLNARLEELNESERTVAGLLNWFTAQSYQYAAAPNGKKAEEYFLNALNIFNQSKWDHKSDTWTEDIWNVAWSHNYLADLYCDLRQADRAIKSAHAALEVGTSGEYEDFDEQDHEVIGYSYRVLGDAYKINGDLGQAFADYAQAGFHSCVFNVIPHKPDEYTTTLYKSIRNHIASQVVGLQKAGNILAAQQSAQYLYEFWSPYWNETGNPGDSQVIEQLAAAGDLESLSESLFPPAPVSKDEIDLLVDISIEMAGDLDNLSPAQLS